MLWTMLPGSALLPPSASGSRFMCTLCSGSKRNQENDILIAIVHWSLVFAISLILFAVYDSYSVSIKDCLID